MHLRNWGRPSMRNIAIPYIMLVMFLLLAQPFMIAPSTAQKPKPGMSIDVFYPSFVEVQTPLDESLSITFYTNVTVIDPDNKTVEVNLNAFLYVDWAIEFTPKTMQFTSTGVKPATVIVTVPKNVSEPIEVQVHLKAFATYPNDTMETISMGWISLKPFYSIGVQYQYIKKNQNMNVIEFTITNNGNDNDNILLNIENGIEADREEISILLSGQNLQLEPGSYSNVRLVAEYYGAGFPKKMDLQVSFRSINAGMHDYSPEQWNVTVPVSYVRPDTTVQNYIFAGAIGAFIVVMIIVAVIVVRNPSKK